MYLADLKALRAAWITRRKRAETAAAQATRAIARTPTHAPHVPARLTPPIGSDAATMLAVYAAFCKDMLAASTVADVQRAYAVLWEATMTPSKIAVSLTRNFIIFFEG